MRSGAPTDTGFFAFAMPFELSTTNGGQMLNGTVEELDVIVP